MFNKKSKEAAKAPDGIDSFLQHLEAELKVHGGGVTLREVGGAATPKPQGAPTPVETIPTEHEGLDEGPSSELEASTFGLATVRIVQDPRTLLKRYEVDEPHLTLDEIKILAFVKDTLFRSIRGFPDEDNNDALRSYLIERIDEVINDHSIALDDKGREKIIYYVVRDFIGYERIDVLMKDPMIEDVSCDGSGVPLFVFHRRHGSIRTNVQFPEDKLLDGFVIKMAERSGKHISIADPILDATLPDRSRLNATLAREVTSRGSSFTIRRFREVPITVPELMDYGTLSPDIAAYYWLALEEGMSALIAGGTASGKTTALNAMSLFIPPDRKIVSIEDTRELNLPHENWIAGVSRLGFGDKGADGKAAGTIDTFKLLEAALRQRPEYILVGEVRGREAFTLFQAMATGHATYSTMHADSAYSAVRRLENPPINVPRIMLGALDILVVQLQMRYQGRAVRRVKELVEFLGMDPATGELLTNTLFRWDPRNDTYLKAPKSYVLEKIMTRRNWTAEEAANEWTRRAKLLEALRKAKVFQLEKVAEVIGAYYARPDETYAKYVERGETP
ncbi:MAG TPA: type II/IV secretion system ATPase subunit [Candidatus Thermoplasmatota archaeon]|nr:type II/IV secretion system ATPase subunit [Candidatus Thermoplasmatota archaeon]